MWIFTFGVQKRLQNTQHVKKVPKKIKIKRKNKKKIPQDNWKTFLKRVYNPKSKKITTCSSPHIRTYVHTYGRKIDNHIINTKQKKRVSRKLSAGDTTTKATVTKFEFCKRRPIHEGVLNSPKGREKI